MKILVARPFNHAGPRQAPSFVCSEFGRRFAEFVTGRAQPVLHVGNLDARRDFTDVRDVAAAYWKLFDRRGEDTVFNVCAGHGTAIREIIDLLAGVTGIRPEVRVSRSKTRAYEASVMVGSHERLTRATGWVPTIPLRDTLRDVVDYWKNLFSSAS
jgi:GDP-4-dehydro-6-deoxy-D-mannose reductase